MSQALEILEQRKQAGIFGATSLGGMTPFGRAEYLRRQRGALPVIPESAVATKAKSLAHTQQIQDVTQKLQNPAFRPPPIIGSQAERDLVHTNTMNVLKKVEASRTAPKLPLPPGPEGMKAACFDCPALDVLRLRAA